MPVFSEKSLELLSTCDPLIQLICKKAIRVVDFAVICGHRNEEKQNEAYEQSYSLLKWPQSQHNKVPSEAVDIVPWNGEVDWNDIEAFHFVAGVMLGMAWLLNINLEWGGDFKDKKGNVMGDYGHFELRR